MLKNYVAETCARFSSMCHACVYKFIAPNRMQLCSAQETCMHVTKVARFDCSAVFGFLCPSYLLSAILVQVYCTRKLAGTCIIFLTQEICTHFWYKILEYVSPLLVFNVFCSSYVMYI